MKLIAREPTQEMVDAATKRGHSDELRGLHQRQFVRHLLIAAWEAAPQIKSEPVAWRVDDAVGEPLCTVYSKEATLHYSERGHNVTELFTHPSPRIAELEAENKRLKDALLSCARQAEALKMPCGMDPESKRAIRNGQYQSISVTAHIALGTIMGPKTIDEALK